MNQSKVVESTINANKAVFINEASFDQFAFGNGSEDCQVATSLVPSFWSEELRLLSLQLDRAIDCRRNLLEAGQSTGETDAEILGLKRRMRHGGHLSPGYPLSNRYTLLSEIGEGGFAKVWHAVDRTGGNNEVAIKVLHPIYANDNVRRDRFFRGARVMVDLAGPKIVKVYESSCSDDGYHYFVMELIAGGNLAEAVASYSISMSDAEKITLEILSILADAHAKGFVHRDVKPTNVMMNPDGSIKLSDFDLVIAPNTTGGTRGGVVGTFGYASPEQFTDPEQATVRSDIFGAARTSLFLLNGSELSNEQSWSLYFDPFQVVESIVSDTALASILTRALHRDPLERYSTAGEFIDAIKRKDSFPKSKRKRPSQKKMPGRKLPDVRTASGQKKRYPLPRPTRKQIDDAIVTFDDQYRDTSTWTNFLDSKSHRYAIKFNEQLYPVKMILELAGGIGRGNLSGTMGQYRKIIESLGFEVVVKRLYKRTT